MLFRSNFLVDYNVPLTICAQIRVTYMIFPKEEFLFSSTLLLVIT